MIFRKGYDMGSVVNITDETLDSFAESLTTNLEGIEQQYLQDCTDYETNISVNAALHDAFNKRNTVIYQLLSGVQGEITNIYAIKNTFNDLDDDTADSYEEG